MDNPTKVDLFYERWEPFHLQIVSIAVKYASEEVQANRLEESFQPLCSPSLPPTTPPTTTPTPLLVDSLPPPEPNPTAHSSDNHYPTLKELSSIDSTIEKEEKVDHPKTTTTIGYSRVPTRSEEEKIKEEEIAAEKAEELDQGVHQEWLETRKKGCEGWMKFILESVKVDPASLPEKPLRTDLTELLKEIPSTMHVEIIHDLVIFSLSASHISPTNAPLSSSKPTTNENLNYSALDRQLVFQAAEALGIEPTIVYGAEKLVAQELFFILQQQSQAASKHQGDGEVEDAQAETTPESKLTKSSKAAILAAAGKKKWLRYLGAGAGVIVGGVAIGLTGGLAAPVLAPFLVGLSGGALGFLATSGGAILIGTLFGLAGGGLVGYRAQRRLKGIDEFTFERLPDQDGEVDGDLPRIPSLHATIVSSGFLLTATEYKDMWMPTLSKTIDRRDVYALKVETGALLSAGKDLETYIRDTLLQHGATEIIRHTVLASVCAALLLPASIYKAAVMALDNEYQRTRDICEKAGILLAVRSSISLKPHIYLL
ncbi:hypothetical protein PGT21_016206 [Puccinia graminis f. sp. tritici]|uniref:DUF726-domain-containing protein n=1 Tax=Puccinia graminis f. sp. tritici TaxID=56615 RepID=A0A5B0P9A9_PUCGR|nr:hypothetical protein PGT21_016206 [Puccinia graminis f. sp. tritici]KAA1126125.1 hypothetical protein PGTUg99_025847 [Puccinia graminis f. sp. tritici]